MPTRLPQPQRRKEGVFSQCRNYSTGTALTIREPDARGARGSLRFPKSKVEIWLPSSTELYMDFQGHRFYRRHTFTDFNLFSVKIDQQFGDPK